MISRCHVLAFGLAILAACLARPGTAQSYSVLHAFNPNPDGAYPLGALLQASDGNFYGMTRGGGTTSYGTVFKLTPAGAETVLYSFGGSPDGEQPQANLIQAADGDFYGTTEFGGASGNGTIFKITPSGTETVLHSFGGAPDGAHPDCALLQASDGNFYGTTRTDGASGYYGTVFKITPAGAETVLYSFTGGADGDGPAAGVIQATDGNLYGTTTSGGTYGYGTVFKITLAGAETVLYSFKGTTDGSPNGGILQATDGNFYGTTVFGGASGNGTVFKITPTGTKTILHSFGAMPDAAQIEAGLVQASDGNFYGTGASGGSSGYGAVFKITPAGGETVLHSFSGTPDGFGPFAALIQASDGNLYSTTNGGGAGNDGAVFKVTPAGAETVIHSLGSTSDGAGPLAALLQASDGNFYGTTFGGGAGYNTRYGSVFKITPAGTETVLYSFSGGSDGGQSYAPLIQASDGNFYGTTEDYGANGFGGTVFKLTQAGAVTVLHSFTNSTSDGLYPGGGLIQASDGNFYGTTFEGGAFGNGTVFKITSAGTVTLMHSFAGYPSDGQAPYPSLIQASDGNLYGTTAYGGAYGGPYGSGTVFKITLSGTETLLHSFGTGSDGARPGDGWPGGGGLIQATDGNLYGTTSSGGANGYGTVFKITLSGAGTVLYSFSGSPIDGASPVGSLIQASDGNLYGTTQLGGTYHNYYSLGDGTVFQITTSGTETLLHSFGAGSDGNAPIAGLIQATDGNLYGTTSGGGSAGGGTVFRLSLNVPAPILTSLSPASRNAGSPSFTLVVKGSNFTNSSVVHWTAGTTNTVLTTTYVSATQLKASVPASLIANPGKATVTVVTSSSPSNSKPFTILVTTLKLTSATLSKNSTTGVYTANLTLKNAGYLSAQNVSITKASLGSASTSTTLPLSLGTIAAGATASTSLSFSGSAGTSGTVVTLKVSGTFTGGTFAGSLKVTLP